MPKLLRIPPFIVFLVLVATVSIIEANMDPTASAQCVLDHCGHACHDLTTVIALTTCGRCAFIHCGRAFAAFCPFACPVAEKSGKLYRYNVLMITHNNGCEKFFGTKCPGKKSDLNI
jgi:hypothetical protein